MDTRAISRLISLYPMSGKTLNRIHVLDYDRSVLRGGSEQSSREESRCTGPAVEHRTAEGDFELRLATLTAAPSRRVVNYSLKRISKAPWPSPGTAGGSGPRLSESIPIARRNDTLQLLLAGPRVHTSMETLEYTALGGRKAISSRSNSGHLLARNINPFTTFPHKGR